MIIKKKFDCTNINWGKDPKFNEMFLKSKLYYFNDMLNWSGAVLLRDLYMDLGLETTAESCINGWVKGIGKDDFVKFSFSQIYDTPDFELIFECYPILVYLNKEERVE